MNSITKFTKAKWDVGDIVVQIDGKVPDLYTADKIFTLSFDQDHITLSSDVYGNGIAIINHNGQATLTVSLSRLGNVWSDLLGDKDNFKDAAHEIVISTPVEKITTSSAYIGKVPDITGDNSAPNVDLAFKCVNASVDPFEQ